MLRMPFGRLTRPAAGLFFVFALVTGAAGALLAQPNPSPEPAPPAITPPPPYTPPPPLNAPSPTATPAETPPVAAPTPVPSGLSPAPAPSGSASPSAAPSASPSPSATPVPYRFVYAPSPAPTPSPGAPAIFEVDVNDQTLAAPGPLDVRVLTTPEVATVTMTLSIFGRNVQIQIPKSATPGTFQLDDKLPNVPSFIKGRNYNVTVVATVPDGRNATVNVTLGLAR